ncbi:MAG: acyl-CoA dehydrogenase family protein [Miltoncostaeaceae bacterium]
MSSTIDWAAIGDLARDFSVQAAAREASLAPSDDQVERLRAIGVWDLAGAVEAGGGGASLADLVEVVEDVAAGDLAPALLLAQRYAAFVALRASGATDEALVIQRRIIATELTTALVAGRTDALRASEQADGAVALSGRATHVHGAGGIDALLAIARLGEHEWVHALVTRDDEGVVVTRHDDILGLRRSVPFGTDFDGTPIARGQVALDDAAHRDHGALGEAILAALTGAAVVGAARGSVESAAALTRVRTIPRPVPGVTSPTQDPLSQVVLGAALVPIEGARALVQAVAADIDQGTLDTAAIRLRALAALDVALDAGLEQGEQVYEVVGTSGSGNRHGYDRLWRDVRTLSLAWPIRERRRELGRRALVVSA